ncbi:hypothetical protein HPG69_017346 [Diceros bicornis minor]|uniref:Solute carrier family 13 member 3 n=1 Tax=Diceros bicornis minor TaxID=77932 RepID=A0A7J7ENS6_DICBM|nr:hypothetical protein HPG69_017346 [Diceros bicornis minor]
MSSLPSGEGASHVVIKARSKDCPEEAEAPLDLLADSKKEEDYRRNIWKGFLISIPYSASIGGTATLTGTAPNLILLGQLKSFFPQCDVVNFGSWFIFAFPLMLLFLLVGWLWISFLYGGLTLRAWRKKKSEISTDAEDRAHAVIREEFQNLGPTKCVARGPRDSASVSLLLSLSGFSLGPSEVHGGNDINSLGKCGKPGQESLTAWDTPPLTLGTFWGSELLLPASLRQGCVQPPPVGTRPRPSPAAVCPTPMVTTVPAYLCHRFAEQAVFILFCMFAILLFSRDPKFIPGWASLFTPGFLSDAVTGVTIVTILFFFPSQRPSFKWWFDFKAPNTETEPLLTWKKAQDTVPWNVILLLGGGFAMAKGCEESGLSTWIGGQLHPLENVPPVLAVLLITVVISFFTEFASNTATIIIFLPVLAELAIRLRVHPLYLMIPGTVGCSYAFMLPVSTPPNSIAFASGHLLVKDMVRTGLLMNLMGVLLLSLAMNTWAQAIFQLGTFPDWADIHSVNVTAVPSALANDTFRTL